jgi:hypothetical protein
VLGELYREAMDIFICLEQFYKDRLVAWEIAHHQQQSSKPDSSAIKLPINTPAFSFQKPFGTTFYHRPTCSSLQSSPSSFHSLSSSKALRLWRAPNLINTPAKHGKTLISDLESILSDTELTFY